MSLLMAGSFLAAPQLSVVLVWYELHETMESVIFGEKRIKEWKRVWKLRMIESGNFAWKDLYLSIVWLDSGLLRNDGQGLDSGLRRNETDKGWIPACASF